MQRSLAKGLAPGQLNEFRATLLQGIDSTGEFTRESIRAKTATQMFTESLIKQDLGFSKAIKSRHLFNDTLREQYKLQKMTAVQWSKNASGGVTADVVVPRGTTAELDKLTRSFASNRAEMKAAKAEMKSISAAGGDASAATQRFTAAQDMMRARMGLVNTMVSSSAANMIKWGKNTQWAGRQLMVGFTVPFAAFAAAAGVMANQVDQEMTRIRKVYDVSAQAAGNSTMRKAELDAISAKSMKMASDAARQYGIAMKETLNIEAELAATGLSGNKLLDSTAAVNRAVTLGELDKQSAIKGTIALQSVYRMNSKQLTEAFDYMTAVANGTSLSMQDFIDAIPRGAGVMKNLGVSFKQLGPLLVALKQNGISAAEGMNGLRSAAQRLLMITPKAESLWSKLLPDQKSLTEIVQANKGQFIPTMEALGKAMEKLPSDQKQSIIARVFGIYQSNKIFSVLDGMTSRTGQMAKAYELLGQTAGENAQIAANTLDEALNSPSKKFKRSVETLKAQLAQVGKTFLQLATVVMTGISNILAFFNKLPAGAKKALIIAGIFAAAVGPVIMLVGLFANFIGNIIKLGANLAMLSNKWRIMTAEQRASQLLSEKNSMMWSNEGTAAQALAQHMTLLANSLNQVAVAQNALQGGSGILKYQNATPNYGTNIGGIGPAKAPPLDAAGRYGKGVHVWTPNGGRGPDLPHDPKYDNPNAGVADNWNLTKKGQRFTTNATKAAAGADLSTHSKEIARDSEVTAKNWGKIGASAGGLGMAVGMMGAMTGHSGTLVSNLSMGLMVASLIGPAIAKGLGVAILTARVNLAGALYGTKMMTGIKGMTSQVGKIGPMMEAMRGAAGPLAIVFATIGVILVNLHSSLVKARKEQDNLNNSAKDWANILGFAYSETSLAVKNNPAAKAAADQVTAAEKLAKTQPLLIENIRNARTEQQKLNIAMQEGIKASQHGASPAEAMKVVRTSLMAALNDKALVDSLMIKVKGTIDFGDPKSIAQNLATQIGVELNNIKADNFARGWKEKFADRIFGSNVAGGGVSTRAKEAAKGAAEQFLTQFNQTMDHQDQRGLLEGLSKKLTSQTDKIFNDLKTRYADSFAKQGINTFGDLQAAIAKKGYNGVGLSSADGKNVVDTISTQKMFARQLVISAGMSQKAADGVNSLSDALALLSKKSGAATMDQNAAINGYSNAVIALGAAGSKLSVQQKLDMLNLWRRKAGMEDATSIEQGFGDAVQTTGAKLDAQGKAIAKNAMSMADWQSAVSDATKSANSGFQEDVISAADDKLSKYNDNVLKGIQTRADKETAALDKQQKNHDDKWDKMAKKEKAAEDMRQANFEREKTRLERLANMANKNIDFNLALRTGKLDEAAKIQNDMKATTDGYALDDAAKGAKAAADKRTEILDAKKKAYDDEIEAKKKAIDKQAQMDIDAKKAEQERNKKLLDNELKVLRAFIPKDAAERAKQVAAITAAYDRFGAGLQLKGKAWGGIVADALSTNVRMQANQLSTSVNWAQIGAEIANQFTVGTFNMSTAQFTKWITTGEVPKDFGVGAKPKGKAGQDSAGKYYTLPNGHRVPLHSGGVVGLSSGKRNGVSASAGRYPSEVDTRLRVGEAVLNAKATRQLGADGVNDLNNGNAPRGVGGALGMAGLAGAVMSGIMRSAIQAAIVKAGMRRLGVSGPGDAGPGTSSGLFGVAKAGKFAGINLGPEQLQNASTIMNVGKSMGATQRDLIVSLMTAMQESGLKNLDYGDRDSLGLFQQRPSQGWGTREQILDPKYAATQFFKRLLANGSRNSMSLSAEAQSVQRSAFPDAYAKWETMAREIISGAPQAATGKQAGWRAPLSSIRVNRSWASHPDPKGLDLNASIGTPIYAAAGGTVTTSADLKNPDGSYRSYGRYVAIDNGGGYRTLYAHMSDRVAKQGEAVNAGQLIGYSGSTGHSTGPHLHFETWKNGVDINPSTFIPGLKTGGYTLNDGIAMLHKKETVLTAPLTEKLNQGINNFANSTNSDYTITVDLRGTVVREEADIAKIGKVVEQVIHKKEKKMGRDRSLNT